MAYRARELNLSESRKAIQPGRIRALQALGNCTMSLKKWVVAGVGVALVSAVAMPADAAHRKLVRRATVPAAAVSAAIANAPHDARYERGFICYTDHFHYGSSAGQASRRAAEIAAAGSWESFVDFEYGSAWARFSKAGSKGFKCEQSGGGWGCSVEARPCR